MAFSGLAGREGSRGEGMQEFEDVGSRYEDVSARCVEAGMLGNHTWSRGEASVSFGYAVPDEYGNEAGLSADWNWDGELA